MNSPTPAANMPKNCQAGEMPATISNHESAEGIARLRQVFPLSDEDRAGRAWEKMSAVERGRIIAAAYYDAPPTVRKPQHWHSWSFMQEQERQCLTFQMFSLWLLLDGDKPDGFSAPLIGHFRDGRAGQ